MLRSTGPRRVFIAAIIAASVAFAIIGPSAAGAAESTTLAVEGAAAESGEEVAVAVTVTGASNVAGYQAHLTFDPDVVRVSAVEGVDFADPVKNIDNDEGWVFITQARATGVADPTLARITFAVDGEAGSDSSVAFVAEDTKLNDENGDEIPATLRDGVIEVEETTESGSGTGASDGSTGSDGSDGASSTPAPGDTGGTDGSTATRSTDASPVTPTATSPATRDVTVASTPATTSSGSTGGPATLSPTPDGSSPADGTATPGQPGFTALAALLCVIGLALLRGRK